MASGNDRLTWPDAEPQALAASLRTGPYRRMLTTQETAYPRIYLHRYGRSTAHGNIRETCDDSPDDSSL